MPRIQTVELRAVRVQVGAITFKKKDSRAPSSGSLEYYGVDYSFWEAPLEHSIYHISSKPALSPEKGISNPLRGTPFWVDMSRFRADMMDPMFQKSLPKL